LTGSGDEGLEIVAGGVRDGFEVSMLLKQREFQRKPLD
jgi:hypothetical protein